MPPDTDLQALASDLGFDKPVVDPTTLAPEALLAEVRELTKRLLEYGAKFPKILMLFVKDLLFIDGSLATLAPDIDLFGEVTTISNYFTSRYGERIAHDIGIDPREHPVDMAGVRAAVGVGEEVETLSYRDLQARSGADPAADGGTPPAERKPARVVRAPGASATGLDRAGPAHGAVQPTGLRWRSRMGRHEPG